MRILRLMLKRFFGSTPRRNSPLLQVAAFNLRNSVHGRVSPSEQLERVRAMREGTGVKICHLSELRLQNRCRMNASI